VRFLSSPLTYASWAVLVVVALMATAAVDPYVFGFTCLIAGWITGALAIAAVSVTIRAKELAWSARAGILGSVLVAGAAIVLAFARLGTHHWA
jgi:hypothetical protein